MARIERAEPVLGEAGIGRLAGEAGQRLVEGHALLGPPSARRLSRRVLPADRGGEAGEGVGRFDREIRPESEMRAGRGDRLPGVGALEPRRVQARFGHRPVAGLVGRLHRGDDPGLGDARDVGRIDHLDMLDPPAAVALEALAEVLIGRDHLRVGGIADRMDGGLETRLGRRASIGRAARASVRNCSPRVSGLSA